MKHNNPTESLLISAEDMKNRIIDPSIQRVEIANEILTVLFFFYQVSYVQ